MKEEIIKILREHDQTFVFTDSYGNNHPFQGVNPNRYDDIATRILEQLGEASMAQWLENKIQGCNDLGGMEKEKWAFQQCLKEARKLSIPLNESVTNIADKCDEEELPEWNKNNPNSFLPGAEHYIPKEEPKDSAEDGGCPQCKSIYIMEHRYDTSYKICMSCKHNWKD